jgi:hypothetical protein
MESKFGGVSQRGVTESETDWQDLQPRLDQAHRRIFSALVTRLSKEHELTLAEGVEPVRVDFRRALLDRETSDRQALLSVGLVLLDLVDQGWRVRVRNGVVQTAPPQIAATHLLEKARIRRQELIKRNAQLRRASVRSFVRSLEAPRLHGGQLVSVFQLMRDGRELAERLRSTVDLKSVVDPYLQFVDGADDRCVHTGLRLSDVWRYFRHTWTNQSASVPGRSMAFLVRDASTPFHCIVGIGSLSSPIMQMRERDLWIGWHPEAVLDLMRRRPSRKLVRWLFSTCESAIADIFQADLISEGTLTRKELRNPSAETLATLRRIAAEQKELHRRFGRGRDYKGQGQAGTAAQHWIQRAKTHLFKSKRCAGLAGFLETLLQLRADLGEGATSARLAEFARSVGGSEAIRRIARKAKADRVGIMVADISVCGAVQPYNALLGGKLVAMLAASPEVVERYRKRYGTAQSEIASAMAGRPVIRRPELVLVCTTSLYGVGSSQYNRIRMPCSWVGGADGDTLAFEDLGRSQSFGTSHYSDETVSALVKLSQQTENGRPVNSIFGEGVSPRLRKVREGLDLLGLPSDLLLRHHRPRVIYGVRLVANLQEVLLGVSKKPRYLFRLDDPGSATAGVCEWWRGRWLRMRISSPGVLEAVAKHTHVHPIVHGARVQLPEESDAQRNLPF